MKKLFIFAFTAALFLLSYKPALADSTPVPLPPLPGFASVEEAQQLSESVEKEEKAEMPKLEDLPEFADVEEENTSEDLPTLEDLPEFDEAGTDEVDHEGANTLVEDALGVLKSSTIKSAHADAEPSNDIDEEVTTESILEMADDVLQASKDSVRENISEIEQTDMSDLSIEMDMDEEESDMEGELLSEEIIQAQEELPALEAEIEMAEDDVPVLQLEESVDTAEQDVVAVAEEVEEEIQDIVSQDSVEEAEVMDLDMEDMDITSEELETQAFEEFDDKAEEFSDMEDMDEEEALPSLEQELDMAEEGDIDGLDDMPEAELVESEPISDINHTLVQDIPAELPDMQVPEVESGTDNAEDLFAQEILDLPESPVETAKDMPESEALEVTVEKQDIEDLSKAFGADEKEQAELEALFAEEGLPAPDIKEVKAAVQEEIAQDDTDWAISSWSLNELSSKEKRDQDVAELVNKRKNALAKDNDFVVPNFMYKRAYNKSNSHLPKAIYQSDLDRQMVMAAAKGDMAGVRSLLNSGVSVNSVDNNGNSALMLAVANNHKDLVNLLILRGADINVANNEGVTALHVAIDKNKPYFVNILLYKGADVNVASANGTTALMRAIMANNDVVFNTLVDNGANIRATTRNDVTALHTAAQLGQVQMVERLLKEGAVPNAKTKDGFVPEELAVINGHSQIASTIALFTAELIKQHQAELLKEHKQIKQEREELAQAMSMPFDGERRYNRLNKAEQHIWDQRLRNWVNVQNNFDDLNLEDKILWNDRRKKLQSIYAQQLFASLTELGADPIAMVSHWDEFEKSLPQIIEEKKQRKEQMLKLISDWKATDAQFDTMSFEERVAANTKRIQMLEKLLGGKESGELSDVFFELPIEEREQLRASMAKWDVFERTIDVEDPEAQFISKSAGVDSVPSSQDIDMEQILMDKQDLMQQDIEFDQK